MADPNAHFHKIMMGQYRRVVRAPDERTMYLVDEKDSSIWYVLLTKLGGDNDEFESGEYIVEMRAKKPGEVGGEDGFPYKPPEFYFYTPQGVYGINEKVCISIGEFHSNSYMTALGMNGFCLQLISGLIGWKTLGSGIRILTTNDLEKKRFAMASKGYNDANHKDLVKRIKENYASYSVPKV